MLHISNIEELKDHIFHAADKPLQYVTVCAPDQVELRKQNTKLINKTAKDGEDAAEKAAELYNELAAWLQSHPDRWILKFKRTQTEASTFPVEWRPAAQPVAQPLQGVPAMPDIEAIVQKRLEEYELRRQNEELKAQLQGMAARAQFFAQAMQPMLLKIAEKFMPAGSAQLQGAPGQKLHELPEEMRVPVLAAVNRILQHVEPEFLIHLANYLAENQAIIPTIKQLTGYEQEN